MTTVITNRNLCKEDFLSRIEYIAKNKPHSIILREKDLNLDEYAKLYFKCKAICDIYNVPLFVNTFTDFARNNNIKYVHTPFYIFEKEYNSFSKDTVKGVSVHSINEAIICQKLGADYIIAGHIFSTDCKKDVPPRGIDFLKNVVQAVNIPVFAIGGITKENAPLIYQSGAKGICIMSSAMNGKFKNLL